MNHLKLNECDTLKNYFTFIIAEEPTYSNIYKLLLFFTNVFGTRDYFWAFGQVVIGNI